MYVLQHADRPELYEGLPKNPEISPVVQLWKGFAKPFGALLMGLTVLAGFIHAVTVGPKETPKDGE